MEQAFLSEKVIAKKSEKSEKSELQCYRTSIH